MNKENRAKCQAMSPLITHTVSLCCKYPAYSFSLLQLAQWTGTVSTSMHSIQELNNILNNRVKHYMDRKLIWAGWVDSGHHQSLSEKWDAVTMTSQQKREIFAFLLTTPEEQKSRAAFPKDTGQFLLFANHNLDTSFLHFHLAMTFPWPSWWPITETQNCFSPHTLRFSHPA